MPHRCADRHGDGAAVARIILHAKGRRSLLTIAVPVPPSAARLTGLLLLVSYGTLALFLTGTPGIASRGDRRGKNTTYTIGDLIDAAAASL